jgi:protein phosphatase
MNVEPRLIHIPSRSLVVLIGLSGSGKSTWAQRNFKPTQIVSADTFRGMLSDSEGNQEVSSEAFRLLFQVVGSRLSRKLTTVVDNTSVTPYSRAELRACAIAAGFNLVGIHFNTSLEACTVRSSKRLSRQVPAHVINNQYIKLYGLDSTPIDEVLQREGFTHLYTINQDEFVSVSHRGWVSDEHKNVVSPSGVME